MLRTKRLHPQNPNIIVRGKRSKLETTWLPSNVQTSIVYATEAAQSASQQHRKVFHGVVSNFCRLEAVDTRIDEVFWSVE